MAAEDLASYKPPWNAVQAKTSVQSTGMHEAAANLLWINAVPPTDGDEGVIAGDPLYWPHVVEAADIYFGVKADQRGHLSASSQGAVARLMFPTTLYVHADSLNDVEKDAFDSELRLLSGHSHVAGW